MSAKLTTDAVLAKLLANIPALHRWSNHPLDRDTLAIINTADKQTLMSIVVHALTRLREVVSYYWR